MKRYTSFKPIGGVYIFAKRVEKSYNIISYPLIYIGQTSNLAERFSNHHKADCINRQTPECVCVLLDSDEDHRMIIEKDIIGAGKPPCND